MQTRLQSLHLAHALAVQARDATPVSNLEAYAPKAKRVADLYEQLRIEDLADQAAKQRVY